MQVNTPEMGQQQENEQVSLRFREKTWAAVRPLERWAAEAEGGDALGGC